MLVRHENAAIVPVSIGLKVDPLPSLRLEQGGADVDVGDIGAAREHRVHLVGPRLGMDAPQARRELLGIDRVLVGCDGEDVGDAARAQPVARGDERVAPVLELRRRERRLIGAIFDAAIVCIEEPAVAAFDDHRGG